MSQQSVSTRVSAVNPVYPTVDGGVQINTGTFDQAAAIEVTGITNPIDGDYPTVGDNLELRINGDVILTADIEESGRNGENQVQLVAYSHERRLHQHTLTASYTDAAPGQIIRDAFNQANVEPFDSAYPFPEDFASQFGDLAPIYEQALSEARQSDEITVTTDFNRVPCIAVIDEIARSAGWVWKVTDGGRGFYGDPGLANQAIQNAGEGALDDFESMEASAATPTTHNLRWILADGTSPAFQAPPFDLIRVVGRPTTISSSGAPQPITVPTVAEIPVGGGDGGDSSGDSSTDNNGPPRVHVYRDDRITSTEMASNIARELWKKVERDRATGTVTCVGDIRFRPLDSARMLPELSSDPENPDFYRVDSVIHRIDSDGFISEITLSGSPDLGAMPNVSNQSTAGAIVVSEAQGGDQNGGGA